MADFETNDSYNLLPIQTSDLNCSRFFYPNPTGRPGSQTGNTFVGPRATFTAAMKGGLIAFSSNVDGASYSYNATILEVVDAKTLTLDISQDIAATDYIIWYGGVQFNQQGNLSVQNLLINGDPVVPSISSVNQVILTSLSPATYTPTAGTRYMIVEGVGAGGSGGNGGGVGAVGTGGGGGGGAGGDFRYVGKAETFTYECGVGGSPQAGAGPGNAGTATSIGAGLYIPAITANGGAGGSTCIVFFGIGGNGGTVTGAPISLEGQQGFAGMASTSAVPNYEAIGGAGGKTPFGNGGGQVISSNSGDFDNGKAAIGYGGGGGGSARANVNPTGMTSGAGGNGVLVVTEFI